MYGNTVKDGSGNAWWTLVDPAGKLIITNGVVSIQSDATANDSDKTFTVPAATNWEIMTIYVTLVSTSDVGNRQMRVIITDASDNVLVDVRASTVQAASVTRYYQFAPGIQDFAAFRDTDLLATVLPYGIVLPAGYKVRVYDKAAIAAAADDMTVRMLVRASA